VTTEPGGHPGHAFVGIGSNVEPEKNVRMAVVALGGVGGLGEISRLSTLYRTRAIGSEAPDFINGVILLITELGREELVEALTAIEDASGRKRADDRYAARVLDLDLLLFVPGTRDEPAPSHPDVFERPFVAGPLAEIAPDLILPGGLSIRDVAAGLGSIGVPLTGLTGELRRLAGIA